MSKKLLRLFRFPFRVAPGEAEAECAMLQRHNVVDAVMSEDVDAIMWGSTMTLRDWSQEGTRGNKTPTHVTVLRSDQIKTKTSLDSAGMILMAMLSGGDYAPDGVPGFGPGLASEIAKAGFGSDLLEIISRNNAAELAEWKERLQYELESNTSGYFRTKHKSAKLPNDFPDAVVLRHYTHPMVSTSAELQKLHHDLLAMWKQGLDVAQLREFVAQTFNWLYRGGACKFIRSLAPALLSRRLFQDRDTIIASSDDILERRMHFINDGIPELRLRAVPVEVVGWNLDTERDHPDDLSPGGNETHAAEEDAENVIDPAEPDVSGDESTSNTMTSRKRTGWDPVLPDKMWIPETIVKLGVPAVVEGWEQKQRDMLSDARKYIAGKARKMNSSTLAPIPQTRAIHTYFPTTKASVASQGSKPSSPRKKASEGLPVHSATPTRRKVRPQTVSPSALTSRTNPFSMASQSTFLTKPARSNITTLAPGRSSSNNNNPGSTGSRAVDDASATRPIRRKARALQKSQTLPCTWEEEPPSAIVISSSPTPENPPEGVQHISNNIAPAAAVTTAGEVENLAKASTADSRTTTESGSLPLPPTRRIAQRGEGCAAGTKGTAYAGARQTVHDIFLQYIPHSPSELSQQKPSGSATGLPGELFNSISMGYRNGRNDVLNGSDPDLHSIPTPHTSSLELSEDTQPSASPPAPSTSITAPNSKLNPNLRSTPHTQSATATTTATTTLLLRHNNPLDDDNNNQHLKPKTKKKKRKPTTQKPSSSMITVIQSRPSLPGTWKEVPASPSLSTSPSSPSDCLFSPSSSLPSPSSLSLLTQSQTQSQTQINDTRHPTTALAVPMHQMEKAKQAKKKTKKTKMMVDLVDLVDLT